ncbi:hypothetical protein ACLOJK_036376 [Asimina triloba]
MEVNDRGEGSVDCRRGGKGGIEDEEEDWKGRRREDDDMGDRREDLRKIAAEEDDDIFGKNLRGTGEGQRRRHYQLPANGEKP